MGMAKTLPFKMNDTNMLRIIREIAEDTSRVFILKHAKERMRQRKISQTQVYSCLRKGSIVEPAHLSIYGDWKCTMQYRYAGDEINVSVALEREENGDYLAVITVF